MALRRRRPPVAIRRCIVRPDGDDVLVLFVSGDAPSGSFFVCSRVPQQQRRFGWVQTRRKKYFLACAEWSRRPISERRVGGTPWAGGKLKCCTVFTSNESRYIEAHMWLTFVPENTREGSKTVRRRAFRAYCANRLHGCCTRAAARFFRSYTFNGTTWCSRFRQLQEFPAVERWVSARALYFTFFCSVFGRVFHPFRLSRLAAFLATATAFATFRFLPHGRRRRPRG